MTPVLHMIVQSVVSKEAKKNLWGMTIIVNVEIAENDFDLLFKITVFQDSTA